MQDSISVPCQYVGNEQRHVQQVVWEMSTTHNSIQNEPVQLMNNCKMRKLPAIPKHIKVLERAGLVIQGQKAQYRPCTFDATHLEEVLEQAFDKLADHVRTVINDK